MVTEDAIKKYIEMIRLEVRKLENMAATFEGAAEQGRGLRGDIWAENLKLRAERIEKQLKLLENQI